MKRILPLTFPMLHIFFVALIVSCLPKQGSLAMDLNGALGTPDLDVSEDGYTLYGLYTIQKNENGTVTITEYAGSGDVITPTVF